MKLVASDAHTDTRTDGQRSFDSSVDADSKYIIYVYFMRSKISAKVHCKLLPKMNIPPTSYKDEISKFSAQNELIKFTKLIRTQCSAVASKQFVICFLISFWTTTTSTKFIFYSLSFNQRYYTYLPN